MESKRKFVIVSTTIDKEEEADRIAEEIIDRRLAACVQKHRIDSLYHWKGKVVSSGEYGLHAKTKARLARELCDVIKALHTYEVPEIIITPIEGGLSAYLKWIDAETA